MSILLLALPSLALAAAPTASNSSTTVNEDTNATIRLVATDPERQSMTYEIVTPPTRGTYTISGSTVTYRGSANLNGADSFVWRARDSGGSYSNNATASISVTAVNDTPTCAAVSASTSEDTAKGITLSGTDVEGSALTYTISSAPATGSVSLSGSTATYTPPTNWSGSTTFRYTVNDGTVSSAACTVTVTVSAVNDAPTASNGSGAVNEDGTATFGLTGADVDSTTLTYSLVSSPTRGSASLSGRNVTYTPTANYNGTDSFTFRVTDGTSYSSTATYNITVNAVNDVPTVTSGTATTTEDHAVSVTLSGTDVDGNALTYSSYGTTVNGTVTFAGNVATFTPNAHVTGTGRFGFRAHDGTVYSGSATVTVTINAANDPPTAASQSVSTTEDTAMVVTLTGDDPDGGTISYAIASQPAHGTVSLAGRAATYTPEANWNGTDSFTFVVSDGTDTSAPATVSVAVAAVNDPPVLYESYAMTAKDSTITLDVVASDPDSTLGNATIVTNGAHGNARVSSTGVLTYNPDLGFLGMDHFTIQVTDGTSTAQAEVHVSNLGTPQGTYTQWGQVGVNSIPFYTDATGDVTTASATYQGSYILGDFYDLGVESYRQLRAADVTWESFEPTEGSFQYDDSDDLFGQDEVEPRVTVFDTMYASPTPPWATTSAEFQKSMNAEAYRYLDDVLALYADEVRIWEVGNEMFHWVSLDNPETDPTTIPDMPTSYPSDGYSPEEQAEFLRDASNYIRAHDSDAVIVLSSILPNADGTHEWLERVVAHTGSDWFDVITWHNYDEWNFQRGDRRQFRDQIAAWGLDDKLIQLTETGTSAYGTQTAKTDYPNSDETQAADVFRLFVPAFATGDSVAIWHTYREFSADDDGTFGGLGLLDYDASLRPAAYTFQLFASELLPLVQATDLSAGGAYLYQLKNHAGDTYYAAWGTGTISVPSGMTQYASVYPGNDGTFTWTATGATLTLEDTPVLLR